MAKRESQVIRKTYASCIALFTAGCFMLGTVGCGGGRVAPDRQAVPARQVFEAAADNVGAQKAEAPVSLQARELGVRAYEVNYVDGVVHAVARGEDNVELASLQVTQEVDSSTRVIAREGGVTHDYTLYLSELTKTRQLTGISNGRPFALQFDGQGHTTLRGSLPYVPSAIMLGLMGAVGETAAEADWGCWTCAGVACTLLALAGVMIAFPAASAAVISYLTAGYSASGLAALMTQLATWLGPGVIAALDVAFKAATIGAIVYCLSCVGIKVTIGGANAGPRNETASFTTETMETDEEPLPEPLPEPQPTDGTMEIIEDPFFTTCPNCEAEPLPDPEPLPEPLPEPQPEPLPTEPLPTYPVPVVDNLGWMTTTSSSTTCTTEPLPAL